MAQQSGFGEAEARRIIERAAELDEQQKLDANALRQIALEAGISPASVDKALEEHLQVRPGLFARVMQRRGWLLVVIIFVALVLVTFVSRISPPLR
jgi:hypothetical protein